MIPPDQEIYEVERRIAERRHRVEAVVRQSGEAAMRTLTSPWALVGAAVLGFFVAGRVKQRREHHAGVSSETKAKAKGGAIAGLGMAAMTWLIKSQFGSPMQMAQFFLSKVKKQPPQP